MKDETIKPALTGDEWAWVKLRGRSGVLFGDHASAAIALHDKPYGFTHYDAVNLTHIADTWEMPAATRGWLYGLAGRIAALLPPWQGSADDLRASSPEDFLASARAAIEAAMPDYVSTDTTTTEAVQDVERKPASGL